MQGAKSKGSHGKKGFSKEGSAEESDSKHTKKHGKIKHHNNLDTYLKKSGSIKGKGKKDHDGLHSNRVSTITKTTDGKPVEIIAQPSNNGYMAIIRPLNNQPEVAHEQKNSILQSSSRIPIKILPHKSFTSKTSDENNDKQNQIIDNAKDESIIEAVVIKNGKKIQISSPDNSNHNISTDYSLDSNVIKFLEMLPDLKGNKFQEKLAENENYETTTSTTTVAPDLEIVLRKQSPNSRGYSYVKKSTTPIFNNCTGDSNDRCSTFTQQSRSSFTIEYIDDDFDDSPIFRDSDDDFVYVPDSNEQSDSFEQIVDTNLLLESQDGEITTTEIPIMPTTLDILSQLTFDSKKLNVNATKNIQQPTVTSMNVPAAVVAGTQIILRSAINNDSKPVINKNRLEHINNTSIVINNTSKITATTEKSVKDTSLVLNINSQRKKLSEQLQKEKSKLSVGPGVLDTSYFIIPPEYLISTEIPFIRRRRLRNKIR